MAIQIRLLGPIEAWVDEREVDLGGVQMRALLAFLALRPGQCRSTCSIVDALWPEDDRLPVDPRQAVHTYVCRLRAALGPTAVPSSRAGGYRLDVSPDAIDAVRLQRMVGSSAEDPAVGDEPMDQALSMWRGQALEGLDHLGWVLGARARLVDTYASAVERWARDAFEQPLSPRDCDRVVSRLRDAIDADPQRARLSVLLDAALRIRSEIDSVPATFQPAISS